MGQKGTLAVAVGVAEAGSGASDAGRTAAKNMKANGKEGTGPGTETTGAREDARAAAAMDRRIAKERRRISGLYKTLPEKQKKIVAGLIDRAAFARVQCEELERDLTENGWTEPFAQGDQEPYDRARPQSQLYNSLNTTYLKIISKLETMLPKADAPASSADDGFDDFLSAGKFRGPAQRERGRGAGRGG